MKAGFAARVVENEKGKGRSPIFWQCMSFLLVILLLPGIYPAIIYLAL